MNKLQSTITEQIQNATTAAHDANTRVVDSVVDANRSAVDFAVKSVERIPSFELPVDMPVEFPSAAEAGERYLDFVERAADVNRDLNKRVVEMLPADIKPTVKRAAKKTTTKKAAAKK